MTIADLIERLEEYDPDAEVRLATQPSYSLAFHLGGVVGNEDMVAPEADRARVANIVWLLEGSSAADNPYAPREAWDAAS